MANFFLNKGGAGISISREETARRLNPLIESLIIVNHYHDYVIENVSNPATGERLAAFQKLARVDVGKLAESVFSAGGVAYNGIDLEPRDFNLGGDDSEMLGMLRDREQAFYEQVLAEGDVKHHIRTKAILNKVASNSKARLDFLGDAVERLPGRVAARG